jgi:hypothetical protein
MNVTDTLKGNAHFRDSGQRWPDEERGEQMVVNVTYFDYSYRVTVGEPLGGDILRRDLERIRRQLVGEAWEKLMAIRYLTPLEYGGDVIREVIDLLG